MATNIPPHNMREVADACTGARPPRRDPRGAARGAHRAHQGTDFTGATILGHKGIEQGTAPAAA
ncbi:MAG: hypothetical protein ACLT4Y_07260 [Bifidobacterium breve]